MPTAFSSRNLIILGTTPLSKTVSIFFLPPSLCQEIAQKQSCKIYLSVSLPLTMTWHSTGMANLMLSYLGRGLPRHKLDRAQQQRLMCLSSVSLSIMLTKLISPPSLIILSRLATQPLEMLPIAHIACSTIPKLLDKRIFTKSGIPPLSTMDWHCAVVPEATHARAHPAYNCNWGYSCCLIYSIIFGTKPALITA